MCACVREKEKVRGYVLVIDGNSKAHSATRWTFIIPELRGNKFKSLFSNEVDIHNPRVERKQDEQSKVARIHNSLLNYLYS